MIDRKLVELESLPYKKCVRNIPKHVNSFESERLQF